MTMIRILKHIYGFMHEVYKLFACLVAGVCRITCDRRSRNLWTKFSPQQPIAGVNNRNRMSVDRNICLDPNVA